MKFNLNLQGAQEIGNYMNPGQYSVKIKNFEGKQSKNGHPQFAITFAHKEAGEFVHFANADMTTDYAKNWIYTFLSIAGLQGVNGAFSFTERDLIGKPLNIELKREFLNNMKLKMMKKVNRNKINQVYMIVMKYHH